MNEPHDYIWEIYSKAFEEISCPKFCGAFTAEEIRKQLKSHNLPVSRQDVFIRNVPIQIDLLIHRPRASVRYHGLMYEPDDVLAVLEIKYRGTFSADAIGRIHDNFQTIQRANTAIACFYLTVVETRGYKNAVTSQKLGYPAYTLYWYGKGGYKKTNDWDKLVMKLKKRVSAA